MGSLSSLLSIAQGALSAHAAAVDITGKNITNANTPGYVRRQALLETRMLGRDQSGGVVFNGPLRMSDRFAVARVLAESGQFGSAVGRQNALAGLESTLAPAGEGGISGRFNAFFSAVTALGQNPNDPTARAAFLARADELGQSFRTASEGLFQRRTDLAGQAGDVAGEINSRLGEVADLNEKIAQAQALGDGAPDLRDKRELLVREIGDRMGVQAIEEDDGSLTLLSSGAALVSKGDASTISVGLDPQGALAIGVKRSNGTLVDVTNRVDTGTLGGIRQARDTDVVALQTDLDQLAFDTRNAINGTHAAGFGLDGVTGRNLFAPPAAVAGAAASFQLDPAMVGQPDRIAVAGSAAELPGGNSNALALAAIGSQSLAGLGDPVARIGAISGKLGIFQTAAAGAVDLRSNTLSMAETSRQQASGVSIEEEMVDLTRYQRAFEASMRVLKVADELLQGVVRDL